MTISIDQYAVIGNPIAHSKSPLIHTSFAKATSQALEYTRIEGGIGQFATDIDAFRARGGLGLNITTPFKLDAFAYATDLSERAKIAGAVNAMKFENGRAYADNFDGISLVRDIVHNLKVTLRGKRILMLGAGGAARGAMLPFLQEGPALMVIANRTVSKAMELIAPYVQSHPARAAGYDQLASLQFDVVLNATSASLRAELPPLPSNVFAPGCLAYELAYGKGLTPFLQFAKTHSVHHLADGVGMLAEQAAEAFAWWRGVRPDTQDVIRKITIALV